MGVGEPREVGADSGPVRVSAMGRATGPFARNRGAVARGRWGWREDILRRAAASTASDAARHHRRMQLEVRPFDPSFIDDAAGLLAARHGAHRAASPGLDPAFEQVPRARAEIERLMLDGGASEAASGVAASGWHLRRLSPGRRSRSGHLASQRLGRIRRSCGRRAGGGAGPLSRGRRALGGRGARPSLRPRAGRRRGPDRRLVPAGLRPAAGACPPSGAPGVVRGERARGSPVRLASRSDLADLARIDRALPEHQARSPVFSRLPIPSLEEVEPTSAVTSTIRAT